MYYKNGEHELQIFNSDVEMDEFCHEKIDDYLSYITDEISSPLVEEEITRYQQGADMSMDDLVKLVVTLGQNMVENQNGWGVVNVSKSSSPMSEVEPILTVFEMRRPSSIFPSSSSSRRWPPTKSDRM